MNIINQVFLLNTEIEGRKVNEVLERAPLHPVVKFISEAEYKRHTQSLMNKHVVREGIRNMSGKIIIVHYIKFH